MIRSALFIENLRGGLCHEMWRDVILKPCARAYISRTGEPGRGSDAPAAFGGAEWLFVSGGRGIDSAAGRLARGSELLQVVFANVCG
jgi:hypothetical protein